ncbi:MAG: Stp1/IreP family PP2C-type Ser/Thr phosphatase [Actinobacteria bacterium]|nr:MAG: Stp1/IreP family PP2C-type Ser/Thr phosphatase [Actinomycetota bacterium]
MRIGRTAVVTDTGRRRIGNEDAYVFKPPFFAIADGMGGARAGEIAAGLAAAALEEGAEPTSAEGIVALIDEANRQIWERSIQDPDTSGMGTTVTAALVAADPGKVVIGHVGDSRAYLYRDGTLAQLTTDHSLVVELVESGILTPEEAERHPQRSAITRAVGTEPTVEVDAFTVDAEPGDLYLICSDGLTDMLTEEELEDVLEKTAADPARAADALVAAANARGGEDNITVVLFEMTDADAPAEDAEPGVGEEPPIEAADHLEQEPTRSLRRHGAGPGGRVAAILLLLAVLGIGLLLLYLGFRR